MTFPYFLLVPPAYKLMWDLKGKSLLRKAFKQSVSISGTFFAVEAFHKKKLKEILKCVRSFRQTLKTRQKFTIVSEIVEIRTSIIHECPQGWPLPRFSNVIN